jgi:DNA-binding HxlR family transcriptional regulator
MANQPVWDPYQPTCPTRLVLERIADKWTVLIVGRLAEGTKRFGELQRELGGISQKMLTQVLRGLERDGLVKRQVYATVPPKVEYSLTPAGRTLIDLLERIRSWAIEHVSTVLAAQRRFDGPAGRSRTGSLPPSRP